MSCSFFMSMYGTGEVPSLEKYGDDDPLVGAVYAWQNSFIEDFQSLQENEHIWQVAEQNIEQQGNLLKISAYVTSFTLSDSPVLLSQVVTSLWSAVHSIYNLDVSRLVFTLDSLTTQTDMPTFPNFQKYDASCRWMEIYRGCTRTLVNVDVVSDLEPSLNIAAATARFIKSCGIPIDWSSSTFCDGKGNPTTGNSYKDSFGMIIPNWDPISIAWLLSALVGIYLPKAKRNLDISLTPHCVQNYLGSVSNRA